MWVKSRFKIGCSKSGLVRNSHAGKHDRVLDTESLGERRFDLLWGCHCCVGRVEAYGSMMRRVEVANTLYWLGKWVS